MNLTEKIIVILIYAGIGLLSLKLFWELMPFDWINKQLCSEEDGNESENEENSDENKRN